MGFYALPANTYVIKDEAFYLVYNYYNGAICKISPEVVVLIEKLLAHKDIEFQLSSTEKPIFHFLLDNRILRPSHCGSPLKPLNNVAELNHPYVIWFKNLRLAIMKITGRCNLNCGYCYEEVNRNHHDMTLELFCKIAHDVVRSTKSPRIKFLFHGGEPTLMSTDWFFSSLSFLKQLAVDFNKTVIPALQTNLVDISEEKLALFKKFNVKIGGSIDSPEGAASNMMRQKSDKAISTMLRAKSLGLNIGVLLNINHSNVDHMRDICFWVANHLQKKTFKANIVWPVGHGKDMQNTSALDIFNAQKDIIEYMIETKGGLLEVNLCEEIARYFECHLGGKGWKDRICDGKKCGASSSVLAFSPAGDIFPCGRFSCSKRDYILGNVNDYYQQHEGAIVRFREQSASFGTVNDTLWDACPTCLAHRVCKQGCRAFMARLPRPENIECGPTLLRFKFYDEHRDDIKIIYEAYRARESKKTAENH